MLADGTHIVRAVARVLGDGPISDGELYGVLFGSLYDCLVVAWADLFRLVYEPFLKVREFSL